MEIKVIGDKDTVTGFQLAGIDGKIATSGEEIESALKDFSEAGLIIINEKQAALVRESIKELSHKNMPLIIEIPDWEGPSGEDKLAEIYQQAVGLKMKK